MYFCESATVCDTFNKVVDVISQLIKATIAEEVRQAGKFSVQIDTTQDISSKDQCSIILRYVTDVIHERLIAMVECESSTGQHFAELLKKCYKSLIWILAHVWATSQMEQLICRDSIRGFLHSSLSSPPIRFIYGVMHIF